MENIISVSLNKEKVVEFADKWFWRTIGVLLWLVVLNRMFNFTVPRFTWAVETVFSDQYNYYRYFAYILIPAGLVLWKGFWYFIGKSFYLLFFPFLICVYSLYNSYRVCRFVVILLRSVVRFFFTYKALILAILIAPLSATYLLSKKHELALLMMIVLGFSTYIILLSIFRWSLQPLRVLEGLVASLMEFEDESLKTDQKKYEDINAQPKDKKDENLESINKDLSIYRTVNKFLDKFNQELGSHQLITVSFIAVFLFSFAITVVAFTCEYVGLETIRPGSFTGLNSGSIFDYFYMSLMWLATASPGIIEPVSKYARVLIALETLTGIGLLTFLILCFSLAINYSLKSGQGQISKLLNAVAAHIALFEGILLKLKIDEKAIEVVPEIIQDRKLGK